jgi:hypothetical protein
MVTNGKLIPNLSFLGSKTISGQLNVTNLTLSTGAISGNIIAINNGSVNAGVASLTGTATYSFSGNTSIIMGSVVNPVVLSSGTFSNGGNTTGIGLGLNGSLTYTSGDVSGLRLKGVGSAFTINANGSGTFSTLDFIGTGQSTVVTLSGTLRASQVTTVLISNFASQTVDISGTGALSAGDFYLFPSATNNVGSIQYKAVNFRLNSSATHLFGSIISAGYTSVPAGIPNSATSSTISALTGVANITVSDAEDSYIYNTNFTNINASGGQTLYVRGNGTLSGTTNIVKVSNVPAASVSGGSWTFVQ